MPKADARTTSVGELSGLLPSRRLRPEGASLSPDTIGAYADDGALGGGAMQHGYGTLMGSRGAATDQVRHARDLVRHA
jgi:hypothetical protein